MKNSEYQDYNQKNNFQMTMDEESEEEKKIPNENNTNNDQQPSSTTTSEESFSYIQFEKLKSQLSQNGGMRLILRDEEEILKLMISDENEKINGWMLDQENGEEDILEAQSLISKV